MIAADLIALSRLEGRTVTECPVSLEEARRLIDDLAVEADDDCTIEHVSGTGCSGPDTVGHYDIWGTEGGEWRVHVVCGEVRP